MTAQELDSGALWDRPTFLERLRAGLARAVERVPNPLLTGQLDDDRPQPTPGPDDAEHGGDRRLADAALASHEHQSAVQEAGHDSPK